MKLAIGMPTGGTIKTQTVFALFRMMHHLPFEYDFILKEGAVIHDNRRSIVKQAIKAGCSHLLFVDSDMYFEHDAVLKLLARKKDIIGTHSNHRRLPLTTTVLIDETRWKNIPKEHPDGLLTCDAVGTGFMLINLDVFKKIPEPWFFWEISEDGETTMGEDHWFCERAKDAGYAIWVDVSVPIKHIGDYKY